MSAGQVYEERLSSPRTQILFAALASVFLLLTWWLQSIGSAALGWTSAVLAAFFLFSTLNYRTLTITVTPTVLRLRFGVFSWTVPLDNVADCTLDHLPPLVEYGGAGIHFMLIRGRYRASLNFLEHPRVVVALRRKAGPVQDVSFSTRHPGEVVRAIREATAQTASSHAQSTGTSFGA